MNGVAVRAMEVAGPPFCTEFRAGSNGTSPGPQNPYFKNLFWGGGVGGYIEFTGMVLMIRIDNPSSHKSLGLWTIFEIS